jgi:single-stranded DNA-binding protein
MQKVFIAGNVSSVKEIRDVGQNKVFNFSVAVSNGKDQSGEWKPSSFYDVSVWNKRGEGTKVAVSGRMMPARVHEGKAYQSIEADEVTLQGGGSDQGQSREPDTAGNGTARYDEPADEIPF